jgi:predicted metal-dependent hydrolase
MPDLNGRDLLREWRQLMEAVIASATSATARKDLPGELVVAMQRQLELVQEIVDRERRLQGDLATRLLAPLDAVFEMLEQTGATIRGQAEALEDAGRALQESAGLMKRQAELFERTIATLRQPTERAKGAAGAKRRAPSKASRKPRA